MKSFLKQTGLRKEANNKKLSGKGFTIIELLIATAVFSVVLVGVLAAFIQISRIFYKGINMSNTQNATRTITQDIVNDMQFSSIRPDPILDTYNSTATNLPAHSSYFCIGGHRYAYFLGTPVGGPVLAGVYRESINSGCPPINSGAPGGVAVNPATADQLLGNGMQLNYLQVDCGDKTIRCRVNVHVVFYGGAGGSAVGLFATKAAGYSSNPWQAPDADCTGALTSSQFCATADYDRSVTIIGFTN